jgi:hypothetical protein
MANDGNTRIAASQSTTERMRPRRDGSSTQAMRSAVDPGPDGAQPRGQDAEGQADHDRRQRLGQRLAGVEVDHAERHHHHEHRVAAQHLAQAGEQEAAEEELDGHDLQRRQRHHFHTSSAAGSRDATSGRRSGSWGVADNQPATTPTTSTAA